jgi:hypothetical protein
MDHGFGAPLSTDVSDNGIVVPLSVRVSGYGQITLKNRSHECVPRVILFGN